MLLEYLESDVIETLWSIQTKLLSGVLDFIKKLLYVCKAALLGLLFFFVVLKRNA